MPASLRWSHWLKIRDPPYRADSWFYRCFLVLVRILSSGCPQWPTASLLSVLSCCVELTQLSLPSQWEATTDPPPLQCPCRRLPASWSHLITRQCCSVSLGCMDCRLPWFSSLSDPLPALYLPSIVVGIWCPLFFPRQTTHFCGPPLTFDRDSPLCRLRSYLSPTILQGLSSGCPVIVYSDV